MTFILAPTKKKIVWTIGLFIVYFVFLTLTYVCPDLGVPGMSSLRVPLPAACNYYFYEGGELVALGIYLAHVWVIPAALIYVLVGVGLPIFSQKSERK